MENVILVDSADRPIGTVSKFEAHLGEGLLHRALSVFVFNPSGDLLLQRRADTKYHFAGLWSNTCCTHPRPGESVSDAAQRRLGEEMGVSCELDPIFVFQYRARCDSGLIEQEVDHVFRGSYVGPVHPDPAEVSEARWIDRESLRTEILDRPESFTPWFVMALPRAIEDSGYDASGFEPEHLSSGLKSGSGTSDATFRLQMVNQSC
jgi:isopentenyl-diphosphate delta-isomerase